MSLNDYPTSLKPLVPYIQRANEFEKRAPIVSFYCRTYAAQLGISIIQSQDQADDEATNLLTSLMDQLEQDKEQLNIEAQEDEAKGVVEVFALKVFKKADDADRAGRHDTQIAKLYYAASILIEVTKQFGDLSVDMMEKQKYAKWRAAEIQKSVRTGQPVTPVASEEPAEEEDDQLHYLPTQTTSNEASNDEDEVTKYLLEQHRLLNLSNQTGNIPTQPTQPTQPPGYLNGNIPTPSSWNFDNNQREDAMKISPTEEQTFPSWNQPPHSPTVTTNNNTSRPVFNTSPTVYEPPQRQVSPPSNMYVPQQQPQQQYQQQYPTQSSSSFNQPPPQQQFVQPHPVFSQPPPQQQPKPVSSIPKPTSTPTYSASPVTQVTSTPTYTTTTTQPVLNTNGPKKEVTLDDMMKAQKLCKFAISSLQFEDVDTARKNLIDALNLLN